MAMDTDTIQEILNQLKCVACNQLPARELFLLGGSCLCTHKYCEKCILSMKDNDKPCVKCTEPDAGSAHNPYPDLITTGLLADLRKYQDCIKNGEPCNCNKSKTSAVDEYEFTASPAKPPPIRGSKKHSEASKLATASHGKDKASSATATTSSDSSSTHLGAHQITADKPGDRKSKRLRGNARQDSVGKEKQVKLDSSKTEMELASSTPKDETVESDNKSKSNSTKSLSTNRLRKSSRRNSNSTLVSSSSDVTPNPKGKVLRKSTTMGIKPNPEVKPSPTVYDLEQEEVMKLEEESIRSSAKLRERKKKVSENVLVDVEKEQAVDIDQDENETSPNLAPASPPELTQHGNTPKKTDLCIGVEIPATKAQLPSPTLPILSPITGKALDGNQDMATPKRKSEKLRPVTLKLTGNGHNFVPPSLCVESPLNNLRRSKSKRSTRSPSVCSNASSNNDSVKSNATTLDSSNTPASEKCNAKGETKLHVACRIGQVEKVKQLLEANVDINACDFAGWTPLHEAINSKSKTNFDVVQVLCEAGCNINTLGLDNETPLHECVRTGRIRTLKFLLSYGASTSLRNKAGKLPKEVTENETIQKILDEFKGPYIREPDESAVIDAFMKNSVTFFTFKTEDIDLLAAYKNELGATVVKEFGPGVTHVIFDQKEVEDMKVPFSLHYLTAVLSGSWLLSSEWVDDSVRAGQFLDPRKYELTGCVTDCNSSADTALLNGVPNRARTNKEVGRPGLFDGFNIYLYKACAFETLKKRDLSSLISIGGGKVVNREPNPDSVDPLDNPVRFHATAGHKMTITSHVILYDEANKPANFYSMEHLKTLRTDWLIESALHFTIMNPDEFS